MTTIPLRLRSRLDAVARELYDIAAALRPKLPTLADMYESLGQAIANSRLGATRYGLRSLPRDVRYPTYMFLDEFQNFVGPDIESALPELRNLGLRLILSHQSFSQLQRGDYDLTSIIFQAQSRMMFGVQGEDAELLAHEVASITFNPKKIKDEIYSRRQLNAGHRIEELESWGSSEQRSDQWSDSETNGTSRGETRFGDPFAQHAWKNKSDHSTQNSTDAKSHGGSTAAGTTHTRHQQLVPVYEEFLELASRNYASFDEQKSEWARDIRNLRTGRALLRLVNDPRLYLVDVKRSAPGFLQYDMHTIARRFPAALEAMDRLIEENFQSDFFVPASRVDAEADDRIRRLLRERSVAGPPTDGVRHESPGDSPLM